jgi:hypothetical protein
MTDKEILDYFSKAPQQVCGRFSNDQLNKELTIEPPKKRFTLMYAWNVLLASLLITKTYAQGTAIVKKPVETAIVEKRTMSTNAAIPGPVRSIIPLTIKGTVLDAQSNLPVTGVSVFVKDTKNGTTTDPKGNFQLKVQQKDSLEFSAIGYETQTILMDTTAHLKNMQVLLKPASTNLQEVAVVAYGSITCRYMMGSVGYKIRKEEKTNWFTSGWKKEVRIYPNPVMRGNSIQVKLSLQQAGEYKLELMNAAGQVMLVQPLLMQTKEQQVDLYTQTKWSAGMYWIRISSTKSKNVYQAKVLLQ